MNHLQTLLHDSLKATGHVEDYAILRRRDFSLRAGSVAFSVSLNCGCVGCSDISLGLNLWVVGTSKCAHLLQKSCFDCY